MTDAERAFWNGVGTILLIGACVFCFHWGKTVAERDQHAREVAKAGLSLPPRVIGDPGQEYRP